MSTRAALAVLALLAAALSYTALSATVTLQVEPRIVYVKGVIHVKILSLPPGYRFVVARLEGEGNSTGYFTLSPGSIAAINLADYGLKPGLYYIAVYDSPGGRLLARIPVLVVKPLVLLSPPRPTVGRPFTLTVTVQPVGFTYRVIVSIDGVSRSIAPGERVKLLFEHRGPYKLCIGLEARIGNETLFNPRVYCETLTLNLPPTVSAELGTRGGYVTLTVMAQDPDGAVLTVSYECSTDNETWRGYTSGGISVIPLAALDEVRGLIREGYETLQCNVTAIDDAGAVTTKLFTFNLTSLLAPAKPAKPSKTASHPAAKPATPGRPAGQAAAPTVRLPLPLPLLIGGVAAAVGVTAVLAVRRRRAAERRREARPVVLEEQVNLTDVIARLDSLEQKVERLIGDLGELKGEVDELRRRVRRLERSVEKQGSAGATGNRSGGEGSGKGR